MREIGNRSDSIENFPDIMDGAAGHFADLYSSYLESPKEFFYMSFLTILGSLLTGRLTLKSEIQPQPRLYVVLLGESSDTRKSTAIDKTIHFFQEVKTRVPFDLNICRGIGSAEGLTRQFCKASCDIKKLILYLDEFKQLIGKCSIKNSVLLPCITTLFESNEYENHTKNSNLVLHNAHLSMLAASTFQTYQNAWKPAFTDIGFNNRIFIVPGKGERKHSIPRIIPDEKKEPIIRKIHKIFDRLKNSIFMIDIPQDVKTIYDEWYRSLEKSIHTKRLDTYALRLLPLLVINESKTMIDKDIVSKVIQLCDWQYQMRQLHDPIDTDNMIAKMEEHIRRQLKVKRCVKERDLKRAVHYNRYGIWVFSNARKNLINSGEIRKNKNGEFEWIDQS